jgi:8-oxo-dGTP pyrophosphatase MutT (NUDIX family)
MNAPGIDAMLARVRSALLPLDAVHDGEGWNRDELDGLIEVHTPLREAAVLVGLVPREAGWQVLLTRRTDALRHHAGQVSFPGGRREPGDADVVAAAVRETVEEVGVRRNQIAPLGLLPPLCTITGFRVVPVVATIDPQYLARPDPAEVDEAFEVPLAFLLDPANLVAHAIEYAGRSRRVLEFVGGSEPGPSGRPRRIWGATASILFNLRERMAAAAP